MKKHTKKTTAETAAVEAPSTVVTPEPAPTPEPVFTLTGTPLDPKRKGLVVEVAETLKTLGIATAAQVTAALLASGAYQKVAPKAAELRPAKPVAVLLNEFVAKGIASTGQAQG